VVTWHGFEAVLIILLALALAILSFRYPKRGVRVCAVLSVVAAVVAATGGYLVVSAGNPAGDALVGNGFIGTYAFLFLTLYCTK
jgi:heme A synthase